MKINNKISIMLVCLLIVAGSIFVIPRDRNNDIKLNFSSPLYNNEKLVEKSEVILEGQITKIKKKYERIVETEGGNGEKVKIKVPYVVYEASINKCYKGSVDDSKIYITTVNNSNIVTNKNSLIFLERKNSGSLTFFSQTQGMYIEKNARNLKLNSTSDSTDSTYTSSTGLNIDKKQLLKFLK